MFAPSLALGNSDILCACACVFSGENKKTGACTPTHQAQAHSHLALAPLDKPGALATIPDPARACHGPLIHSSHVACLLGRARLLGPPGSDHSPACEKASALCPPNPVAAGRCPVSSARPPCQTRWHKTEDRTRRCRASSALAASARDHGGRFLRATVVGFCVALLHPLARISRLSCTSLCAAAAAHLRAAKTRLVEHPLPAFGQGSSAAVKISTVASGSWCAFPARLRPPMSPRITHCNPVLSRANLQVRPR